MKTIEEVKQELQKELDTGFEELTTTILSNYYNMRKYINKHQIFISTYKQVEEYNEQHNTSFLKEDLEQDLYLDDLEYEEDLLKQILMEKEFIKMEYALIHFDSDRYFDSIIINIPTKFIVTKDFNWRENFVVKVDNIDKANYIHDLFITIELPIGKKVIEDI